MAKQRNGTLASNNLRDIRPYVEKYKISHITTGDILIEAMGAGIITEANTIWSEMIHKQQRRILKTRSIDWGKKEPGTLKGRSYWCRYDKKCRKLEETGCRKSTDRKQGVV